MIIANILDNEPYFVTDAGEPAPDGWWNKYPLLALYVAAGCAESSAVPMVPDKLEGTPRQAELAEEQLQLYGPRLVYDMGYYCLVPQLPPEEEFWPAIIGNQYY
jgi:hypothetical protein